MQSNPNSIHMMLQKIKSSMKGLTEQFLVAISRFGKNFQIKFSRLHDSKENVSDQLNQCVGILIEDRKRLVEEWAQIRSQIQGLAASRKSDQEEKSQDVLEKESAIAQASELSTRLEELQKDRDEIVKDRQRLWEEYQKLAESRDELRLALEAKEGGTSV